MNEREADAFAGNGVSSCIRRAELVCPVAHTCLNFFVRLRSVGGRVAPDLFGHFKAEWNGRVLEIKAIFHQSSCRESVGSVAVVAVMYTR